MMQAAAQRWCDHTHPGSIVNIVVVTTHGLYGIAHTIAARSGVIGLSRAVAVEWAPLQIRVNCVAPSAIETEGWSVYTPQTRAAYPRSNPMMRAGSPWDIAEACVYLAGPSARFVTGETLTVDGGGQLWGETWTTGKPSYFNSGPAGILTRITDGRLNAEANAALMRGDMTGNRADQARRRLYADGTVRRRPARTVFVNQYGNNLLNGFRRFFEAGKSESEVVQTYASGDMAVLVVIERQRAVVGGLPEQDWSLRVTLVFRREGGEWQLVHRHADPLVHSISLEQAAAIARG
jgi:hypothetical protein